MKKTKKEKKEAKLYVKIIDIMTTIILLFFIFNSFYAYYSYEGLCSNKKPMIYINKTTKSNITKYNLLFYNIKEEKTAKNRVVTLKLFFLK